MFDLISFPHEHHDNIEAIDRQRELQETALYALDLREPEALVEPVWLNPLANGMHGTPKKGVSPAIVLVRDPIATAYSLFRVSPRWNSPIHDPAGWLGDVLSRYLSFYEAGFEMLEKWPADTLLVRYESLLKDPAALEEVAGFVGIRPKLRPDFVFEVTRFDRFVRPGERTFYREGRNSAWLDDRPWMDALGTITDLDFRQFGYDTITSYLAQAATSMSRPTQGN